MLSTKSVQNPNRKSEALRTVLFFLLLLLLVGMLGKALRSHGITDERFFDQQKNTLDTVCIGSCHLYSTLMPSVLDSVSGSSSYVIGCANMSSRVMYHYLRAALERQSPDLLVLDTFCFTIQDSYVSPNYIPTCNRRNLADLPFRDRWRTLNDPVRSGISSDWIYELFDIVSFHSNWAHFSSFARTQVSEDCGWEEFHPDNPISDRLDQPFIWDIQVTHPEPLREEDEQYLKLILSLAEEKDIQILFFSAPYEISQKEKNMLATLKGIADAKGIAFIDFTDSSTVRSVSLLRGNMADTRHVNRSGAQLISAYMGEILRMKLSD